MTHRSSLRFALVPAVFGSLMACIAPALTHLHVEAYWEKAIQGAIILLAVVADGLRTRKANA